MGSGLVSMHIEDARDRVNDLLSTVDSHSLPLPRSVGFEEDGIECDWMLQEDLEASRAVLDAFPGEWIVHPVSKPTEPVLEWKRPGLEVTLWAHPDSVHLRAEARHD